MESIRRQRRPRLFARTLRRIRGLGTDQTMPVHAALAGVPALAAVQDAPVRQTRPQPAPDIDEPSGSEPGPEPQPARPKRRWRMVRRTFLVLLLAAVGVAAGLAVYESRTSAFEAKFFAGL